MSAIIGIYNRAGRPVGCGDLERMTDILVHRGPDGHGVWAAGPVGLGHRMLWTTPESLHETLPFADDAAGLTITADARIDNRDELLPLLCLTDHPAERVSDSQVILAAYKKWGEGCPQHLLGDFAFAIWDAAAQTLFCARDHFGVKPFYYYVSDNIFAFATEIKALLCLPDVPQRIDQTKVADYLQGIQEDVCRTFFKDISAAPVGHSLKVTQGNLRFHSFWSPDPDIELRLKSDADYAEAMKSVFAEAVRCRTRSAFPVGSMLSGGLDSSSIACTAREILKREGKPKLHTFSAIFPSLPPQTLAAIDERPWINSVIGMGGIDAHFVHPDLSSPMTDLSKILRLHDQPTHPNNSIFREIFQSAQQQNVRVMLEGTDGDSIVSYGLLYPKELARQGRWLMLVKEVYALARKHGSSPRQELWSCIKDYGLKPLVPQPLLRMRQERHAMRFKGRSVSQINPIIASNFARRIGLEERLQAFEFPEMESFDTDRLYHHFRIKNPNLGVVLDIFGRNAAEFGCEARFPFMDKRFAEFCLSLPTSQKLNAGWTRIGMRRAMEGILPKEVQWRIPKSNLGGNYEVGMLRYEQKVLDRFMSEERQDLNEYLDPPALQASYAKYRAGKSPKDAFSVWRAVCLARWLEELESIETLGFSESPISL